MENTLFSVQSLEIEQSVQQIKQLKAAIACRIASLQQAVFQKADLQSKLVHFASQVKELQNRQYGFFKDNVDLEFNAKEMKMRSDQTKKEIETIEKTNEGLVENLKFREGEKNRLALESEDILEKQRELCEEDIRRRSRNEEVLREIQMFQKKKQSLNQQLIKRQNTLEHLRSLEIGENQKLEHLNTRNNNIRMKIDEQAKILQKNESQRQSLEAALRSCQQNQQKEELSLLKLKTEIQNQFFTKKLLKQKLFILQGKATDLQRQRQSKMGVLSSKQLQYQHKKAKKCFVANEWFALRQKIQLETSYSKQYLQVLK